MNKFFKWLEGMRKMAPFLLSCAPFRISIFKLYTEQGPKPKHRDNSGGLKLLNEKTSRKALQRTGIRHK